MWAVDYLQCLRTLPLTYVTCILRPTITLDILVHILFLLLLPKCYSSKRILLTIIMQSYSILMASPIQILVMYGYVCLHAFTYICTCLIATYPIRNIILTVFNSSVLKDIINVFLLYQTFKLTWSATSCIKSQKGSLEVADQSPISRQPVPDQSPTSRRPIAIPSCDSSATSAIGMNFGVGEVADRLQCKSDWGLDDTVEQWQSGTGSPVLEYIPPKLVEHVDHTSSGWEIVHRTLSSSTLDHFNFGGQCFGWGGGGVSDAFAVYSIASCGLTNVLLHVDLMLSVSFWCFVYGGQFINLFFYYKVYMCFPFKVGWYADPEVLSIVYYIVYY